MEAVEEQRSIEEVDDVESQENTLTIEQITNMFTFIHKYQELNIEEELEMLLG